MRNFSFKILVFCILLPPVLYIVSIQSLERYVNEKYAAEIENIYLGDTRLLLNGSIRLKDLVNDNIDRYLKSKILNSYGLKLDVTVSTRKGRMLYPAIFEEDRESALIGDSARLASENFKLMNEGLTVKLNAKVEHNKLLSNAILAVYIVSFLLVQYLHYRKTTNRILQSEIDRSREMSRLLELEEQTNCWMLDTRCWMLDTRCWMLDTRCWISNSTLSVNFNDIQYPETRIQDQSILSMVFIAAAKLDFKILCNYRDKSVYP